MTEQCSVRPVNDVGEWTTLFDRVAHAHMVQSWAYGEAKQATVGWRARRLVFDLGGEPVAICQVLDKTIGRWPVASRINRGPLFLDAGPGAEVTEAVYRALRRQWRYLHGGVLVLAPALLETAENYRILKKAGFVDRRVRGWRAAYLDLQLDEDELRRNLDSRWRGRVKKADPRTTLRTSNAPEDVEWMLERHAHNMSEKAFVGPKVELLRALYSVAPDDFFVCQACIDEEPVCGMVIYRYGAAAECYVGWFGQAGRDANAGNVLYWHAALDMQRRGCLRYDLGGFSTDDRYGQFKKGMRGREYRLLNEWVAF